MKPAENADSGIKQVSLDQANKMISEIEKVSLEIRLLETKYLSDSINNIKERHRKTLRRALIISFAAALITGILYCQLIHCPLI